MITSDGRQIVVSKAAVSQEKRDQCQPFWICELRLQAASTKVHDVQGLLKGYDQATNLILDECHERVYSTKVHLCFLPVFYKEASIPADVC